MKKELNNKGLSLVELVIAIAMSTIVMGAAAMFLYNSEKSYRAAESSIDMQMEAQIIMEQLANWVMESNRMYVKDDKVLVLYYIPRNNGKNVTELYPDGFTGKDIKAYRRVIFADGNRLYMKLTEDIVDAEEEFERLANPSPGVAEVELYKIDGSDPDNVMENCICEYLVDLPTAFQAVKAVSSEEDDEITSVKISLSFDHGAGYTVTNTFSSRNGLFGKFGAPAATPSASPAPTVEP